MYQPTHRTCLTLFHPQCTQHTHTLSTVPKYHRCFVDSITSVSHDSKLFSLRLPTGSYLNVPTGHHLAIRADVDGKLLCTACVCINVHDMWQMSNRCRHTCSSSCLMGLRPAGGLRPLPVCSCSYVKAIECLIHAGLPNLICGINIPRAITGYQ